MLRSNSKSLGNRVVSPEKETERLQTEGFAEKEGFKSACVVFIACVHLVCSLHYPFLQATPLVSSICDHSMLASLLCRSLGTIRHRV